MSRRELDRAEVLSKVVARRLTQREAATQLGVSERHVRRLVAAFEAEGPAGLVSRKRGRPSARRIADEVRERALALVRGRYVDFGPTPAQEKLSEEHALTVSVETLRAGAASGGSEYNRERPADTHDLNVAGRRSGHRSGVAAPPLGVTEHPPSGYVFGGLSEADPPPWRRGSR